MEEEHSLKSMYVEGKKKAKSKAAAAASSSTFGTIEPRFFLFSRNRVIPEKTQSDNSDSQIRQRRRVGNVAVAAAAAAAAASASTTMSSELSNKIHAKL